MQCASASRSSMHAGPKDATRRRWPSSPTCSRTARWCSVAGCRSRHATGRRSAASSRSARPPRRSTAAPIRSPTRRSCCRPGCATRRAAASAFRPAPWSLQAPGAGCRWPRPATASAPSSPASARPSSSSDRYRHDHPLRNPMIALDHHPSGRHFLQIPGPSPVPDRILRAISLPTIDHRGPEFGELGRKVVAGMQQVFQTRHPVAIYPASGTGAWEAALANTLSPGDAVLMVETGHFATLWQKMAVKLGLEPEFLALPGIDAATGLPNAWRHGVRADLVEERLRKDTQHRIRAVCVVHNETSTGVTSDIAAVRRAIDAAGHPALLMVDTISGLASADYRHDEWGVDVTVSGSQKGLMLPPGISFNALSPKALAKSRTARLPRAYWGWDEIVEMSAGGYWPYTPNTNLLYGLSEALDMILGQGLAVVFARHKRWSGGVRAAVRAWGLPTQCAD